MLIAVEYIMEALQRVVQGLPVGTNMALLQMLWMMLQGRLLASRGALFPALLASGYNIRTARRSWAALRYGAWSSGELIAAWQDYVSEQGVWVEHNHGGYRAVAVDLSAFWRPRLKGWLGKHFNSLAGRALPAVTLGVVVRIGQMGLQRVPLLKALVRADPVDPSEAKLTTRLLKAVAKHLSAEEIALFDAGFKLAEVQEADIKQAVIRLAANVTARRNYPTPYQGRGRRPVYGEVVRPLARTYKGHRIAATPPDFRDQFDHHGRTIVVKGWHDLILPGVVPNPDQRDL